MLRLLCLLIFPPPPNPPPLSLENHHTQHMGNQCPSQATIGFASMAMGFMPLMVFSLVPLAASLGLGFGASFRSSGWAPKNIRELHACGKPKITMFFLFTTKSGLPEKCFKSRNSGSEWQNPGVVTRESVKGNWNSGPTRAPMTQLGPPGKLFCENFLHCTDAEY